MNVVTKGQFRGQWLLGWLKGKFRAVISVVKKKQFRVVIGVVKMEPFRTGY